MSVSLHVCFIHVITTLSMYITGYGVRIQKGWVRKAEPCLPHLFFCPYAPVISSQGPGNRIPGTVSCCLSFKCFDLLQKHRTFAWMQLNTIWLAVSNQVMYMGVRMSPKQNWNEELNYLSYAHQWDLFSVPEARTMQTVTSHFPMCLIGCKSYTNCARCLKQKHNLSNCYLITKHVMLLINKRKQMLKCIKLHLLNYCLRWKPRLHW